jgi:hypothetical protein
LYIETDKIINKLRDKKEIDEFERSVLNLNIKMIKSNEERLLIKLKLMMLYIHNLNREVLDKDNKINLEMEGKNDNC